MIQLKNLTKTYPSGTKALKGIDLEVRAGEIYGFIGPNGAGKTTAIKILTGIMSPTEGTAVVGGFDIEKNPVEAKKIFQFVPDHPEIFTGIKAIEYLNFIADMYEIPASERTQRIRSIAEPFKIVNEMGNLVSSFSHGMRQKLMLTAAFMARPKVLILDEPHVGLDPAALRLLKELMHDLCSSGSAVFFSSHVLEVVEHLCHRVAIINKGEILKTGTVDEIRAGSENSLEDIFLEITQ